MNVNAAALLGWISFCIPVFVMTPIAIAQAQSQEEFICAYGSDTRVVSLVKADAAHDPKACRVDYTRNGATSTMWSSKTGYAYCVTKAAALVTKLAERHYSCKPRSVETHAAE